jgi:hydrogenase maturation protease
MDAKVALIGSGNAFFTDEGIGLYAGKYLKENFTFQPPLDIIDGGTLGFGLMPLLQEYEMVIIANTSSDEEKAVGTIDVLSGEELIANQGIKKRRTRWRLPKCSKSVRWRLTVRKPP